MPATQRRLKSLATRGVSQSNINATKLKGFDIPVPPLSEQHDIAAQLAAVDAKLAAEQKRRAALDALFRSLLHQLMTGQVRVTDLGDKHKADRSIAASELGVALPVEAAP
jgi:type I restriction enzyme S subunit